MPAWDEHGNPIADSKPTSHVWDEHGNPIQSEVIRGAEKLPGGVAPGVPKLAPPAALQSSPRTDFYDASPSQHARANHSLTGREVAPKPMAQSIADSAKAMGTMAAPAAIPLLMSNPAAAVPAVAGSAAGGWLGGKAGGAASDLMGGSPGTRSLAETAGNLAGGALGGGLGARGGMKLADMIPNFDRAGKNFETVMGKAGDVPIDMTEPGNHALRISELASRGATMPKVANQFLKRATDPAAPPLTYREARDFASNASRLSSNDQSKMTPSVMREIGALSKALNEANGAAADQVGMRPLYDSAMSEYRNAAKLRSGAKTAIKLGAGAAAGASATHVGKRLFDSYVK